MPSLASGDYAAGAALDMWDQAAGPSALPLNWAASNRWSFDQGNVEQSQRNQSQSSREDSQKRDRSQSREQSQTRDQSERGQLQSRQQPSSEYSENEGGLGVTLMETRDGVRIRQVLPSSPAEKAGLRSGDLVLTIDDERVRSAQDIEQTIRTKDPGDWIDLEVWRNGRREAVEARLASRQRAIGDHVQQFGAGPSFSPGQSFPPQAQMNRPSQFQDGSIQQLAQQIQSIQQQLAQLRQEVGQLRSERQALRPTYDEDAAPGQRNSSSDGQRSSGRGASDRNSTGPSSSDRGTRAQELPDD